MYKMIVIVALFSSAKAMAWGISCCARAQGVVDHVVHSAEHAGGVVSHGVKHSVAVVSDGVTHNIEVLGSKSQEAITAVSHPEKAVAHAVTVVKEIGGESVEILIRARESLHDALQRLEKGLDHLSTETFRQYQALESEIGQIDAKTLNVRQSLDRIQKEITDLPDFTRAEYIPRVEMEGLSFPELNSANVPSFNEIIEGSHYYADEMIEGSHFYGKKIVEGAHFYGEQLKDAFAMPDKGGCPGDEDASKSFKKKCLEQENQRLSEKIAQIRQETREQVELTAHSIAEKISSLRLQIGALSGANHE